MGKFNSALVQRERLLPGIHGLRGVAALAIMLFHLVHIGGISPPNVFQFIGRDFGYGVHLFFILSAFSLMHSTEPRMSEPDWLPAYFIKRLFRIAPLFYFMIAVFVAFRLLPGAGLKDRLIGIVLNLTFTFGFVPSSGIVWGGWSVGVEMIFYGVFPVVLLLVRTLRSAFTLLIISIVVSSALRSVLHFQYTNADPSARFDWSYFSFSPNMCFFAMGIYVYLLNKFYSGHKPLLSLYARIVAIVIIGSLLCFDFGALLKNSGRFDIVLWGIGLSALCAWQSLRPSVAIGSYPLEYLGERSFSIYLLHPVIVFYSKDYLLKVYNACSSIIGSYSYFICASLLLIVILVVAEFTYRFIEVPGINFGRRLIASGMSQIVRDPLNLAVNEHRN